MRYLKSCIPSIRENAFRKDHEIIIFVDSDEDGTIEWLDSIKEEYNVVYYSNPHLGKSLYGIGRAYDFCIDKASSDIVMIFHADMMLGKDADLYLYKNLHPNTVVCSTRIEPPLGHSNNGEKIIEDFGLWPEEFKKAQFNNYVADNVEALSTKTTSGIFAPWMIRKKDFLESGGHDPRMHSCREDSDLFNKLSLCGFKFKQIWSSLVYHLSGRGAGSFSQDKKRHEFWKKQMNNSTREFARKWGSTVKHSPLLEPIIIPKYKSLLILDHASSELLYNLEPFYSAVYCPEKRLDYISSEQRHTSFDLSLRLPASVDLKEFNVIAEVDGTQLTPREGAILADLHHLIYANQFIGETSIGSHKLVVKNHQALDID